MKINKKSKIMLSLFFIFLGWILNAIAWTIAGPNPINTVFLLSGVSMLLGGILYLLINIIQKE